MSIDVLAGSPAVSPTAIQAVARDYLEVSRRATPREMESVRDQLDFLLEMAAPYKPAADAVAEVKRALERGTA